MRYRVDGAGRAAARWSAAWVPALALVGFTMAAAAAAPASAQQPAAAVAPSSGGGSATTAPTTAPAEEAGWLARQWQNVQTLLSQYLSSSIRPATQAGGQAGGKGPSGPPPSVTVSKPVVRALVEWDEYTGRFDATETVEMRARVSGYLTETHFRDGQMVKKGDLLFTIDPRPFERTLEQARAELNQWQARVNNASKDVDRARPLVRNRIVSEKVFDDRENAYEDAQAAMKVAEAKVKATELELSFTRITAPIAGRISRANVSVGNYVAGGTFNSTLLTTIVSQDPVYVYFDMTENNLIKYKRLAEATGGDSAVRLGAPAEFALSDDRGFPHQGQLDFLDNRLDASTATLRGRIVVENPKGLFSAGMFARVRIAASPRYDAVLLPDAAIGTDQSARFVFVVAEDGTVARRVVEPGPLIDTLRVVRSGIGRDDWVVVNGVQRARPGQKVTPKREPIKVSDAPAAAQPPAARNAPAGKPIAD
jgi:RND family efflux transporter MFP subunit